MSTSTLQQTGPAWCTSYDCIDNATGELLAHRH